MADLTGIPHVEVTGVTETRLVTVDLGSSYRTGHDFHTNGLPSVRVTPYRMRIHYARRDGTWHITEIGLIGYPTPSSITAGARRSERQCTYGETTAPAWAVDIARRLLTAIPDGG